MMRLLFLVMVWLVVGGSWARAMDSTQSIPPKVGWNKPSAKRADYAER